MSLGTAISGGASDPPAPIANVTGRRTSLLGACAAALVDDEDCEPLADSLELVVAAELEELVGVGELVRVVVVAAATELLEALEAPQAAISSDAITTIR
jgi:hypothetical protein